MGRIETLNSIQMDAFQVDGVYTTEGIAKLALEAKFDDFCPGPVSLEFGLNL